MPGRTGDLQEIVGSEVNTMYAFNSVNIVQIWYDGIETIKHMKGG